MREAYVMLRGGSWGRRRLGGGGGAFAVGLYCVGFGAERRKDCFEVGFGVRAIGRGASGCRRDRR